MSGRKRRPLKENDAWWQYRKITKTTTKKKFKRTIQFKFRKLFQAAASGEDDLVGARNRFESKRSHKLAIQFSSIKFYNKPNLIKNRSFKRNRNTAWLCLFEIWRSEQDNRLFCYITKGRTIQLMHWLYFQISSLDYLIHSNQMDSICIKMLNIIVH